jgi:hypothetical protein
VTASTDLTASTSAPGTQHVSAGAAHEMADEMADVAGAMFALLLLQAPDLSAHEDLPHRPAEEHVDLAVVQEEPAPVLMPSVPALAVAIAALDLDPSPAPVNVPSIAMPTSLPMPDLVPQADAEPAHQEAPPVPGIAIPLVASTPPHTLAMLSEIGFLDE